MLKKIKTTIILNEDSIPLYIIKDVNALLEEVEKEEDIPFWAELWPSSIALAKHLWKYFDLKDKKVLELGSGIGLPGIAAAKKQAKVTQTDFVSEALEIAISNAKLNKVDIRFAKEDWRQFKLQETFEVILGSDILYEQGLHKYLFDIFNRNLNKDGYVLLADPGRDAAKKFIGDLVSLGWLVDNYEYEIVQRNLNYKINIYSCKLTSRKNQ